MRELLCLRNTAISMNPNSRCDLFLSVCRWRVFRLSVWQGIFPAGIEVCCIQLPGRENRLAEPLFTSMDPLVETMAEALVSTLDRPFALFGHSMGGLIAYELARFLQHRYQKTPNHLFVSACRAPEIPDPIQWHSLSDQELMAELRQVPDLPGQVLEHAELMQLLLPIVRADAAVTETYAYRQAEPLQIHLTVFPASKMSSFP